MERFRTRIMQTTFSSRGFKMPDQDADVSDDTIVETMKKVIDDRTEVRNKLRDLKEINKGLEAYKKDSKTHGKTLKQQMVSLEVRRRQFLNPVSYRAALNTHEIVKDSKMVLSRIGFSTKTQCHMHHF